MRLRIATLQFGRESSSYVRLCDFGLLHLFYNNGNDKIKSIFELKIKLLLIHEILKNVINKWSNTVGRLFLNEIFYKSCSKWIINWSIIITAYQ